MLGILRGVTRDGNQLDALGVCGGGCPCGENGDGICDTK